MNIKLNNKSGSTIFVILSILTSLIILLTSYYVSSTRSIYTTNKIGNQLHARILADSLAHLAFDYLNLVEFKDDNSILKRVICLPSDSVLDFKKDLTKGLINNSKSHLVNSSGDLITLLNNETGLRDLKWYVTSVVNQNDFEFGNNDLNFLDLETHAIPRAIYLSIRVSYNSPGSSDPIIENYLYFLPLMIIDDQSILLENFYFVGLE